MASGERKRYQHEVDRLLGQIAERARELRLMTARGARGPALRDQKQELSRARTELAAFVAAGSPGSGRSVGSAIAVSG